MPETQSPVASQVHDSQNAATEIEQIKTAPQIAQDAPEATSNSAASDAVPVSSAAVVAEKSAEAAHVDLSGDTQKDCTQTCAIESSVPVHACAKVSTEEENSADIAGTKHGRVDDDEDEAVKVLKTD